MKAFHVALQKFYRLNGTNINGLLSRDMLPDTVAEFGILRKWPIRQVAATLENP